MLQLCTFTHSLATFTPNMNRTSNSLLDSFSKREHNLPLSLRVGGATVKRFSRPTYETPGRWHSGEMTFWWWLTFLDQWKCVISRGTVMFRERWSGVPQEMTHFHWFKNVYHPQNPVVDHATHTWAFSSAPSEPLNPSWTILRCRNQLCIVDEKFL